MQLYVTCSRSPDAARAHLQAMQQLQAEIAQLRRSCLVSGRQRKAQSPVRGAGAEKGDEEVAAPGCWQPAIGRSCQGCGDRWRGQC
jgi:hypothetical protein